MPIQSGEVSNETTTKFQEARIKGETKETSLTMNKAANCINVYNCTNRQLANKNYSIHVEDPRINQIGAYDLINHLSTIKITIRQKLTPVYSGDSKDHISKKLRQPLGEDNQAENE
ncbi:RNA polymerase sigma factor, sigma-70 family [Sesbania bispinosa]|nr:RNA polymerase sigma factor, sigma-70 family [Sesbania bispinosa]